jgi:anthranilate synthase component 1
MIFPDKEKYLADAKSFTIIPVFKEIIADFETPLSIFLKTKAKFLLESIERGENVGRYSMIGLGRKCTMTLSGSSIEIIGNEGSASTRIQKELRNPLEEVRRYFSGWKAPVYEGLPPFYGGAIGYLGYETARYFEDIPVAGNGLRVPDGLLVIPEAFLIYDSVKRALFIVISTLPKYSPGEEYEKAIKKIEEISALLSRSLDFKEKKEREEKLAVESNMEKAEFLRCVEKCREYISQGEVIQVVISQKFTARTQAPAFEIYQKLRIINPSPYLFFLDFDDFCLIGSSPEVMVKVQNRELLIKPIAGTRKRGNSIAEDHQLSRELLHDPKERAEHIMLVDLARNDLGRVAKPGSVEVDGFMSVERYSHVMHLVSKVKAELDENYDVFDVIQATFPAGTLTGAPKIRAMEIIFEMEKSKRGPYGGMVFYLGFNGNFDSCITIRTILLKDGIATAQAGAGIVADSIAEKEYEETVNKASALVKAIEAAEQGKESLS